MKPSGDPGEQYNICGSDGVISLPQMDSKAYLKRPLKKKTKTWFPRPIIA